MTARRIITIALLAFVAAAVGYLIVSEVRPPQAAQPSPEEAVVAYYFHGSKRCSSCMKIQQYAEAAVQAGFGQELASGRLLWRCVNVDEPANKHFVTDFALTANSIVLAEYRSGRPVRWENLKAVWDLLGSKEDFQQYVRDSVAAFLKG